MANTNISSAVFKNFYSIAAVQNNLHCERDANGYIHTRCENILNLFKYLACEFSYPSIIIFKTNAIKIAVYPTGGQHHDCSL